MGQRLGGAFVVVQADTKPLKKDFTKAKTLTGTFTAAVQSKLSKINFKALGVAAVAAAGVAVFALQKIIRNVIDLANIQEAAEKRLSSVIRSTGQAAGFTADALIDMAAGLQAVTTAGDETIIAGMAILATFKNIAGDAFRRTIEAALDLSEVMQQDLRTSVVMLGKALNDPIANLGALGRAGIQFTKDQKDLIKTLWASGNQMEAQNIILNELESQFGGAATAARDTFGGAMKAVGNIWGDLKEKLGTAITQNKTFIGLVKDLGGWLLSLTPKIEDVIKQFHEWTVKNKEFIRQNIKDAVLLIAQALGTLGKVTVWFIGFITKMNKRAKETTEIYKEQSKPLLKVLDTIKRFFSINPSSWYDRHTGAIESSIEVLEDFHGETIRTNETIRDESTRTKDAVIKDVESTGASFAQYMADIEAESTTTWPLLTADAGLYADAIEMQNRLLEADFKTTYDNILEDVGEFWEDSADAGMIGSTAVAAAVQESLFDKIKTGYENWETNADTAYGNLERATENFAGNAHTAVSDGFFGLVTSDITSIETAFESLWKSVLRQITDFLAASAVKGLLGLLGKLTGISIGGGVVGGIIGTVISWFGHGTDKVPQTGIYGLHEGEMVLPADIAAIIRSGGTGQSEGSGTGFDSNIGAGAFTGGIPFTGDPTLDPNIINTMMRNAMLGFFGGGPGGAFGQAFGTLMIEAVKATMGFRGAFFDVPATLAKSMGPLGGILAAPLGMLGDLFGDAFNLRGYEALRDMWEAKGSFGFLGGRMEFAEMWDRLDQFGVKGQMSFGTGLGSMWGNFDSMAKDFEKMGNFEMSDVARDAADSVARSAAENAGWTEAQIDSAYGTLDQTLDYIGSASVEFGVRGVANIEKMNDAFEDTTVATTGMLGSMELGFGNYATDVETATGLMTQTTVDAIAGIGISIHDVGVSVVDMTASTAAEMEAMKGEISIDIAAMTDDIGIATDELAAAMTPALAPVLEAMSDFAETTTRSWDDVFDEWEDAGFKVSEAAREAQTHLDTTTSLIEQWGLTNTNQIEALDHVNDVIDAVDRATGRALGAADTAHGAADRADATAEGGDPDVDSGPGPGKAEHFGNWFVNRSGRRNLLKGEMVLPRDIAGALREGVSGGGSDNSKGRPLNVILQIGKDEWAGSVAAIADKQFVKLRKRPVGVRRTAY